MEYFKNYITGKERRVKDLLMDQKFISGLGNIYVNEILFFSRVRPTKKSII
jgi:formamidopyrimidine-DNA glycosylase